MPADFLLLGDSHAFAIAHGAGALGIPFVGGALTLGRNMNGPFFTVDDGRFRMDDEAAQEKLAAYLAPLGGGGNLLDVDLPIVSTIGFNTHQFMTTFHADGLSLAPDPERRFVTRACFRALVAGARRGPLAFYAECRRRGRTVLAVLSPQRFTAGDAPTAQAFEREVVARLEAIGTQVVDVRARTVDEHGLLRREFLSMRPGDFVHANEAYGRIVAKSVLALLAAADLGATSVSGSSPAR